MKISYSKNEEKKVIDQSRREAIKSIGIGGAALFVGGSRSASAETKLSVFASKKETSIIIVGGGTGGMTAAARLRRSAPNAKITLITPNDIHLYQSGQVYVAAGLYSEFDNKRNTSNLLPENVTWLQDRAVDFDPDNNIVVTEKNGKLTYEYLVVAMGCEYDFSAIDGVEPSDFGENHIASVYLNDTQKGTSSGAIISKMWMRSIRRNAAKKELKILFTEPDTPIKGVGASLDMLFLTNDILKGNGLRKKGPDLRKECTLSIFTPGTTLFPSEEYDRAIGKIVEKAKNIETHFKQQLKSIDKEKKIALFSSKGGESEISYDYIHITPPMKPPKAVQNSKLALRKGPYKGWMNVDAETLQHPEYPNVFGIGDVMGLPSGKSAGAIREQAILLQDNIAAILEGNKPPLTYSGYSVSPVKTRFGRIMLAEYTPKGPAPSFPFKPTEPRWIWWEADLHLMRRAYFDLMMRGMM